MKPGYKQTEVGLVPEDWDVKPIGSFEPFVTSGSRGWADYYADTGQPFVRIGNMSRGAIELDLSDLKLVSLPPTETEGTRTQLLNGDILVSITADIGIISYVDDRLEKPAYINQHISLVRLNPDRADGKFCSYFLASSAGQKFFRSITDTGAKAGINLAAVRNALVALPPLREQLAIAEALSDMDGLLGGLDRLIAKKRDLKQAAMQQLLTAQTRLPGFHGEWVEKTLSELADIRSGGTPSTNEPRFWDGDILWCTPTDITALAGHKYLQSTSRTITREGLAASSAELIPARSVVMTSRATIGECAINSVPLCTNQGFKNFVPLQSTDVDFLYYLLTTQKQGFISLCGGSTFLEIGKTQLTPYTVRVPATKTEQTAIAEVLGEMDAELAALERHRDKTRALKQAMMQQLLTGQTRLV